MNYAKFLRAPFFTEQLRLLLPSLINTWGRSTFNYQKSLREIQRKVSKFETRFGMTQLFGFTDEALYQQVHHIKVHKTTLTRISFWIPFQRRAL